MVMLEEEDRLLGVVGLGLFELLAQPIDLVEIVPVVTEVPGAAGSQLGGQRDEMKTVYYVVGVILHAEHLFPLLVGRLAGRAVVVEFVVPHAQKFLRSRTDLLVHRFLEQRHLFPAAVIRHITGDHQRVEVRVTLPFGPAVHQIQRRPEPLELDRSGIVRDMNITHHDRPQENIVGVFGQNAGGETGKGEHPPHTP